MNIHRTDEGHISLGQNYDIDLMRLVEDELVKSFGAVLIEKLDELDTSYHDYRIDDKRITIHYEHYTGIYLMPGYYYLDNEMIDENQKKKEDAMINEIEKYFERNYQQIETK